MEENTIFGAASKPQSGTFPPSSGAQKVETFNAKAPPPPEPPLQQPQQPPPLPSSPIISRLIKIGIGIVVLIALFFLGRFIISTFNTGTQKVTLTYYGLWESKDVVNTIIADFQRQNPNITVVYTMEDIKDYRERLETRIKNGTGPDIFRFHNSWLPMFSADLLPISSDVISKSDFEKLYYPTVLDDLTKNGAIYGIPLEIDTLSLFINTDLFKAQGLEVPKTWEDFLTAAKRLVVKEGETGKIKTAGAALGTYDNITHAPDIISLLMVQNGADLKNISKNQQSVIDALNFYNCFSRQDSNCDIVWDETLDPSVLAFAKGNLAMYFGYSWDVFTIVQINKDLAFQIYPVPALPDRNITIASYWAEGISQKTKYKKEALLFMKFLAQKETQQKLFTESAKTRLMGEPYSRVDLADKLKDSQYAYQFVAQGKNAVSTYFSADTKDNGLNTQLNNYLGNAVRGIGNNESPESATKTLILGVDQVYAQYGIK